jgi:hypothetical protein
MTGKLPDQIVVDPQDIQKQIMSRLMDAESNEELEEGNNAISWGELEGIPIEIFGFRMLESNIEGDAGFAVFVGVEGIRLDSFEKVFLTTGGGNIMAALYNLAKRGELPCVRALKVADNKTKSGNSPLWLVSIDPEKEAILRKLAADNSNPLDEV